MGSIKDKVDGDTVFKILSRSLRVDWRSYTALVAYRDNPSDPFSLLIALILSQNTSDVNSIRAYNRLKTHIGTDLDSILAADINLIEEAIRIAGLARRRAETIKRLAEVIHGLGGVNVLIDKDPFELRKILLSIKGVGFKTVDVFLSLYKKAHVFAVDTHAFRIAKRWGLVSGNASYQEVSRALLEFFGGERSDEAHRLIIALGRTYCRSRNPICSKCPLNNFCPYPEKNKKLS